MEKNIFNENEINYYGKMDKEFKVPENFRKMNWLGGNKRIVYFDRDTLLVLWKEGKNVTLKEFTSEAYFDDYFKFLYEKFGNKFITISINEIEKETVFREQFNKRLLMIAERLMNYDQDLVLKIYIKDENLTLDEIIEKICEKEFRWRNGNSGYVNSFINCMCYISNMNNDVGDKIKNAIKGWN